MLDPTWEKLLQPVGSHKLLSNEVRIKDGGMKEEGLIEVGKWLGSQGAAGEPGRSHSDFNDIIHPQHAATGKEREYKRRTAKSKRDWAMGRWI